MINYGRFISRLSANRKPSLIRELTKILATAPPEMIPLSGGFPNPELFPFSKAHFETTDGQSILLEGKSIRRSLQYLPTQGLPELVAWLKTLQSHVHNPPELQSTSSDLVVTCGSQDGLCKAIEMLLEPGEGVVVEDYVYAGTLSIMAPYEPNYVVVDSDSKGMRPDSLQDKLSEKKGHAQFPKFMYINPTGANPTGTCLPEDRRKQIYKLACQHDLIILEDDPYYYLQFGKDRPPSFLRLDTEGRVLRFDSFSKVLSSGLRLGFVTGPQPLVDRINLHMQASVLHATSLSQVMASELLNKWGIDGFMSHVGKVEKFYKHRRDAMNDAATKHLTGLCEWSLPEGGMFLWLKVCGIPDTWNMIMERAMKKNIMLLPGKAFMPGLSSSNNNNLQCPYLRAAFSVASEKDFDIAFRRLAELIKEEKKNL